MKKTIFTTLFVLMTLFVIAQPFVEIGAGASTQKYGIAEAELGYNAGPLFLQVGYTASLTRNVDAGTYLNAQLGKRMYMQNDWFAEPAVGYTSILRSTDRKELNDRSIIASFGMGKDINDGSVVFKATYCKDVWMLSVGMRYNF